MTRSAAISRMCAIRGRNARAQREMRLRWNAERLAAKRLVDERIADEIATRAIDRLETLAQIEDYLGRLSDERRKNHLVEKDRLCSDVTRIVTDVNMMFLDFQKQADFRSESMVKCRKNVATMLDEFQAARAHLRNERLKFKSWFKCHLASEASRICSEDFAQR